MAQKLLTPFKKLPQQIQNLGLFQKFLNITTGHHTEQPHCYDALMYGILDFPVNLAYDQDLCLLAIAYANGQLKIYGTPGLAFTAECRVDNILFVEFLRNEGRLIVATDSSLVLLELDTVLGCWKKQTSVELPFSKEEKLTAMAVGKGVIYVGSSAGTLRQVAVEAGRMSVGDDELTSLPCHLILAKVSNEQVKESLNLESSQIVSIELYGENMLVGFSGGTVLITKPQPLPLPATATIEEQPAEATSAVPVLEDVKEEDKENVFVEEKVELEKETKVEEENKVDGEEEKKEAKVEVDTKPEEEKVEEIEKVKEDETKKEEKPEDKKRTTGGFDKKHLQAMKVEATKKFRTLSRTIKNTLLDRADDKDKAIPQLSVAPSPRITHILPPYSATAQLRCATFRVISLDEKAVEVVEVLAAYDDGAHLTWKLHKPTDEEAEVIILTNQEVASIPYGPLPCAPIERILARPSVRRSGGVITAFVGGLPRAQHGEKHTLSLLEGRDEHVCFQFTSAIRDIVILPCKKTLPATSSEEEQSAEPVKEEAPATEGVTEVEAEKHCTLPSTPTEAAYILVLTEQELVAIDLTQPEWPVIPSPYLQHLHTADVTAVAHSLISSEAMKHLHDCFPRSYDNWPVEGGKLANEILLDTNGSSNLLALGRSTGIVSLYEISAGDCFHFLGYVDTLSSGIWEDNGELEGQDEVRTTDESREGEEDEAWPPFRRVGHHHPLGGQHIQSRRRAIHCLSLLGGGEESDEVIMLVGGGGGNLSVWSTTSSLPINPSAKVVHVDLLASTEAKFVWEGASDLKACEGSFSREEHSVFSLTHLVQMHPPTPITAVSIAPSNWSALAVGSQFGFAVIDLLAKSPQDAVVYRQLTHIHSSSLLSAEGEAVAPVGPVAKAVARGRLLKKSLHSSFRNLRKSKSQIQSTTSEAKSTGTTLETTASDVVDEAIKNAETKAEETKEAGENVSEAVLPTTSEDKPELAKVEEKEDEVVEVEEEKPDVLKDCETAASGVTCILFADTFVELACRAPVLLVGTRGGLAMIHRISWPADEGALKVELVKQIQLKHAAPVLEMTVLDAKLKSSRAILFPVSDRSRSIAEPKEALTVEEPVAETSEKKEDEKGEEAKIDEPAVEHPEVEEKKEALKEPITSKQSVSKTPEESHELIICTEEQVKLFALPSLKAKHSYRFWGDTGSAPIDAKPQKKKATSLPPKTPVVEPVAVIEGEEVLAPKAEEEETHPKEEEPEEKPKEQAQTEEVKTEETEVIEKASEKVAPQHSKESLRRVASVGLQRFITGEAASQETVLYLVIALHNGCLVLLDLPTLRRVLKAYCCDQTECKQQPLLKPFVSSPSNLVFWPLHSGQIVVNEIALNTASLHLATSPTPGLKGPGYALEIPDWARPKPVVTPNNAEETVPADVETEATNEPDAAGKKEEPRHDEEAPATTDVKHNLMESETVNNTAQQVDELTHDSIKGYLNDESGANVTVKTTEVSVEKYTVIEGGNVVTTIHETERINGEVTKDDVVQVKSSGDETLPDVASAEKLAMLSDTA